MKSEPSDNSPTRFKILLLVDGTHTLEKRLSDKSRSGAIRRAVRWATSQMGEFREGQKIQIHIVKVEELGDSVSIRTFRTRPMGAGEALGETDRIRILKGTKYRSAHPQMTGVLTAKRPYITMTGCKTGADESDVCWKGNGGYMCWTDKEKVERVIE
mgnify:CR=1 FL=1